MKVITRENSERVARYAFDFARRNGRKKVITVHKANIMYDIFTLLLIQQIWTNLQGNNFMSNCFQETI